MALIGSTRCIVKWTNLSCIKQACLQLHCSTLLTPPPLLWLDISSLVAWQLQTTVHVHDCAHVWCYSISLSLSPFCAGVSPYTIEGLTQGRHHFKVIPLGCERLYRAQHNAVYYLLMTRVLFICSVKTRMIRLGLQICGLTNYARIVFGIIGKLENNRIIIGTTFVKIRVWILLKPMSGQRSSLSLSN